MLAHANQLYPRLFGSMTYKMVSQCIRFSFSFILCSRNALKAGLLQMCLQLSVITRKAYNLSIMLVLIGRLS